MKIYYTPESLEDLQALRASVIEEFDSPKLAGEIVRDITKNIRHLEVFPNMGAELVIKIPAGNGYRYLFCRHNYIFYRVERDTVRIVRVLHERQDFMRILCGMEE